MFWRRPFEKTYYKTQWRRRFFVYDLENALSTHYNDIDASTKLNSAALIMLM